MKTDKLDLDAIARRYHDQDNLGDKHIEDACQRYTYDWVVAQIAPGSSVLELGYGEGNFTDMLVKLPISLTVLEGAQSLVDKALARHGNAARFECTLFEDFICEDKFDVIVATHVLEHVDNPVKLLSNLKGLLSPDGRIVLIVPNKESLHRQLAVLMGLQPSLDSLSSRDHLVGHQRVYSLKTLENDVLSAGLRVTQQHGFFLKTLPNSMMISFPEALIDALNKISSSLPHELLANIGIVAQN